MASTSLPAAERVWGLSRVVERVDQPCPDGVKVTVHHAHDAGGDIAGEEVEGVLLSDEAEHSMRVPLFLGPNEVYSVARLFVGALRGRELEQALGESSPDEIVDFPEIGPRWVGEQAPCDRSA
jgi:hypothetical protein